MEILIYRLLGLGFLICVPFALALIVLPARTLSRKRIRWGSVGFIGLGCLFVGWAASWPGPNTITLLMISGGLVALVAGSFRLARLFCGASQ